MTTWRQCYEERSENREQSKADTTHNRLPLGVTSRGVERLEEAEEPTEAMDGERRPFSLRTPPKSTGEYLAPDETEEVRESAPEEAEERRRDTPEEAEE